MKGVLYVDFLSGLQKILKKDCNITLFLWINKMDVLVLKNIIVCDY